MKERFRGGLPVAVLAVVTVAVFWEAVFTGKTFFSRDLFVLYYPVKQFIRDSILSGRLPLWNPHLYCGVPFLGDYVSSVIYPLNVIFLLLPMGWAFKAFICLHYFLGSVFGYLYHRSRGGSCEAALLVGVAFGFSGYLLSMHNNLIYLQTGIWTPLLLLLAVRARDGWGWRAGAGLVLGVQFLGGDLQGAIIAGALAVAVCLLLPNAPSAAAAAAGPPVRRRVLAALAIVVGGVGVAAIQWVPSGAWASMSPRGGGLPYAEATEWSLHPVQIIEMVAPGLFGDHFRHTFWATFLIGSRFGSPWAYSLTLGIPPLLLAIWVTLDRRAGREAILWGAVGLLSLLFAFGSHLFLYRLIHALPGFDLFRYPAKFFYFTTLSVALLSGIGLDRLRSDPDRGVVALRNALLAGTIVIFIAFGSLLAFRTGTVEFLRTVTKDIPGLGPIDAFRTIVFGLLRASFILGMLMILFHLKATGGIGARPLVLTLVAAAILELVVLHARTRRLAPADLYTTVPETVEAVRSIGMDGYRFFRERELPGIDTPDRVMKQIRLQYRTGFRHSPERTQRFFADSIRSNLGQIYRLDDAYGYSPAEPARLLTFLEALRDDPLKMYSLLGVRAFVSFTGTQSTHIPLNELRLVAPRRGRRFAVLENPSALPRAMLFGRAIRAPTEREELAALKEAGFDPAAEVVLGGGEGAVDLGPGPRSLRTLQSSPGRVVFEVRSDSDSFLLWNESWSPGWKAWIDGEPAELHRANFLMQAVRVPSGTREVTLAYRPASFFLGGLVSLLSIASLGLLAARARRGKGGSAG